MFHALVWDSSFLIRNHVAHRVDLTKGSLLEGTSFIDTEKILESYIKKNLLSEQVPFVG
jgi:hypothetical protein